MDQCAIRSHVGVAAGIVEWMVGEHDDVGVELRNDAVVPVVLLRTTRPRKVGRRSRRCLDEPPGPGAARIPAAVEREVAPARELGEGRGPRDCMTVADEQDPEAGSAYDLARLRRLAVTISAV